VSWWNALYQRAPESRVDLLLAEALFDVAVEEQSRSAERVRHAPNDRERRPASRATIPLIVIALVIALAGGVVLAVVLRDGGQTDQDAVASESPSGTTVESSTIAAATEPSFDPERGVWGDYPERTKETVGVGDEGRLVEYLQLVLASRAGAQVPADGIFGAQTEEAVRNAQAFVGLPVTGVVDAATWEFIDLLAIGEPAAGG
jgi:hypothetical protein